MSHFIYIAIILAFLVLCVVLFLNNKSLKEDLDALDKGMTEVTDAYESDSLQYEETLAGKDLELDAADVQIQQLQDMHRREKEKSARLYADKTRVYGKLLDQETISGLLKAELRDCQQTSLEFQQIVEKHNANCLPVIGDE